jgi:phage-related protein
MAGKDNNIGIKISTDVVDLKSGIKSIKDEISKADKEFQKATTGMDKWSTSSEGLDAKLNQLNTRLSSQKKSVELYKDEIERVSKLEGDHTVQLQQLNDKLESAEIAVAKTEREIRHYSTSLEDVTKKEKEAETELGKLTKTISEQEAELKDLQTQYENAVLSYGENSDEVKSLADKIKNLTDDLETNKTTLNNVKDSYLNLGKAVEEPKNKLDSLTDEISDQEKKLKDLQDEYKNAVITYGKNSKEAKELKKEIKNLSGEIDEHKDAVKFADKQLELLDKQFEETTDSAEKFSSGIDGIKSLGSKVAGGIGAIGAGIGALAGAFLATSEATKEYRTNMGKIESGFETSGLKAEQASDVYKTLWSVVADDGKATEATAMLGQLATSQEDLNKWTNILTGVYATFGDALPIENLAEAALETSKTGKITGGLADALNWAGISEEKFQAQLDACTTEQERQKLITDTLNSTYDEASEKYQQVNKDVIDSNKAQVNLTDTMAKLGEKAEPILTAIKDGFNTLLQEVLKLTEGVDFNALAEKIKGGFAYFIDTIIPAIKDGFQWILDNKDILIAGIVAIGTGMLAWNVVSIIQGVVGAVKAWTVATEGMTVAQRLLNLAMSANPIGIIITVITALVTAFVVLWNKSDAFREFWIGLWDKIKEATSIAITKVKEFFSNLWTDIKAIWSSTVEWFKNIGSKISDGFKTALDKVKDFFSNAWSKVKDAWSSVSTWFSDVGEKIVNAFKNIPTKIKEFFSNAWNNVKTAWSTVSTFFTDIKDKVVNAFKELPEKMLTVGSDLVEGLWNGISNMTKWVTDKIKGFSSDVLGGIKKFFGIASPSKEMAKIGKFLDEGLAQGIEKNKKKVTKATDSMSEDVVSSIKGIEEELKQLNIANKIKELGGKVENPFDSWSNSKLNAQINELERKYASINEKLISNGVTQDQWNISSEKMNERAKILEDRLRVQNDLMNLFNAKIKQYNANEVPEWVTKGIAELQKGIEVTTKEAKELNAVFEKEGCEAQETLLDKIEETAKGMGECFSEASEGVAQSFSAIEKALKPITDTIKSYYTQIMDIMEMAWQNQMDSIDAELEAYNFAKDGEMDKVEELYNRQLISEDVYKKCKTGNITEIENAEKKAIQEKNKIAKKQFVAEKINSIAQTTIDGARAIVRGFADLGPVGGAINAVVQAGLTAAQIALISKQKFVPMLAKGGVVDSPTLAMVGEAGKEVVMPLENNTEWIKELAEKLNSFMARDFNFGMQPQLAYAGTPVVNNYYDYNQTINAPKQLSRREIYRDSKNLLSLKGGN